MEFITLKNEQIEVTLCSLGASIFRLIFDHQDMMLSPIKEKDFARSDIYFNKIVGRICGRILKDDEVILHGGPHGLSTQEFSFVKKDNKVTFSYLSKGDKSSEEGILEIKIIYTLIGNCLEVETSVTPNQEMMVYLTHHNFFSLGANSVNQLSLKLDSDTYVTYDQRLLPEKREIIKDKYDFKTFTKAMKYGEIDNYFLLKNNKILLKSDLYQLKLITDYQGVHIYSDYFLDGVTTRLTNIDHHRALAVEPQDDKLEKKLLRAHQTIKRTSKYIFSKID